MASGRDADVLQHLVIDLPEQLHIDFIGLEGIGILAEADSLQPIADLAHAVSCPAVPSPLAAPARRSVNLICTASRSRASVRLP
jgi:hypothetical protein